MAAARKENSSLELINKPKEPVTSKNLQAIQNSHFNRTTATDLKVISHLRELLKKTNDASPGKKNHPELTYGHSVLMNVVYEKYDRALDGLDQIKDLEKSYPEFGIAAFRYIKHAKSLVRALKAKRAVGKLPQVSKTKQKELVATLGQHFADLRVCIVNLSLIHI